MHTNATMLKPLSRPILDPCSMPRNHDLSLQIKPPSTSLSINASIRKAILLDQDPADSPSSSSSNTSQNPTANVPTLTLTLNTSLSALEHDKSAGSLESAQQKFFSNQDWQRPRIYKFKKGSSGSVHGGKRSIRAPRMRWTTALHARFVHAVQLLGGHESKNNFQFSKSQIPNTTR